MNGSSHNQSGHIFLTGASGYLGIGLLEALLDQGFSVTVLCRPGSVHLLENFKSNSALRMIIGDLSDFEQVRAKLIGSKFETLIHCAALPKLAGSTASEQYQSNVTHTRVLAHYAREVEIRRFFHLSTAFVGPDASKRLGEALPSLESGCNLYEKTKSIAEHELVHLSPENLEIFRPGIILPAVTDSSFVHLRSPLFGFFRTLKMYSNRSITLPAAPAIKPGYCLRHEIIQFILQRLLQPAKELAFWNLVSPDRCSIDEVMTELQAHGMCGEYRFDTSLIKGPFSAWSNYLSTFRGWQMDETIAMCAQMGVSLSSVEAAFIRELREYLPQCSEEITV